MIHDQIVIILQQPVDPFQSIDCVVAVGQVPRLPAEFGTEDCVQSGGDRIDVGVFLG